MTTACTFNMVHVNATPFKDCCGVFEEACFVEAVGVYMALNVLLFADTIAVSVVLGYSTLIGR